MHQTIVHPTDFSATSMRAFAHALRIALATRSDLYLVHVADDPEEEDEFPRIRRTLAQWQLLNENDPPEAVSEKLGIKVAKVGLLSEDPLIGLFEFLDKHPADLVVLATHGRDGLERWLDGSVAEEFSRAVQVPTLFVPPTAHGFVDETSGKLHLSQVLIPVDHSPPPAEALGDIDEFINSLSGPSAIIELMHVGKIAPVVRRNPNGAVVPVSLRAGDTVSTILEVAAERNADLIAMPTAGHHGLLDALRGSTTERVLRQAPCPVLAIPVG
jgi:nucleotide-binding universal stress UspA family protein